MEKRIIERNRLQEEMPQVFWDSRYNLAWLRFALYAELFRCEDEGTGSSRWTDYLREAINDLRLEDYGNLDRTIKNMAEYQNVTLIDRTI